MPAGAENGELLDVSMFPPKVQSRFWAKVERRGPSECWPWVGAKSHTYGMFQVPSLGRPTSAHRVAYVLECGSVPSGLVVRHRCATKVCVNPSHLLLGTQKDNMNDAMHDLIRTLCKYDAADIRAKYASGEEAEDLAAAYGVAPSHIRGIVRNQIWVDHSYKPHPIRQKRALTMKQVAAAKRLHFGGETITALAEQYGVALSTMWEAIRGVDSHVKRR